MRHFLNIDQTAVKDFYKSLDEHIRLELKKDPKIKIENLFGNLYDDGVFKNDVTSHLSKKHILGLCSNPDIIASFNDIPKTNMQKAGRAIKDFAKATFNFISIVFSFAISIATTLFIIDTLDEAIGPGAGLMYCTTGPSNHDLEPFLFDLPDKKNLNSLIAREAIAIARQIPKTDLKQTEFSRTASKTAIRQR